MDEITGWLVMTLKWHVSVVDALGRSPFKKGTEDCQACGLTT